MDEHAIALFCRLADCSAVERESYYAEHDVAPPVRDEVESLLRFDRAAAASLGHVVASAAGTILPDAAALSVGRRYGSFRPMRLLGRGGMGSVYEAEQDSPRRTVALKVIHPGLTSPDLVRRFELESHALGRLQHPGIAQIYEAGTADTGFGAQPYFAMELVRGETLSEYVQSHQLTTRERLELMRRVCEAVHHAHQRGIIHRDLKPGNILVDETGQPKILDFGVARVTDTEFQTTRQTSAGQLVGTLSYMSPEQVLADPLDLDTRSDVYALGVILFELLAERLPYNTTGKLHEVIHAIREEDPVPLRTIDRAYRGDIEVIVSKALEKDKARRYASAADLAADIQRHLRDEPVFARTPSAAYQLRKFTKRHTAVVAAVLAVFLVLVAAVVVSTFQAARARRAEQTALAISDFLQHDLLALASVVSQARNRTPTSRCAPRWIARRAASPADSKLTGRGSSNPLRSATPIRARSLQGTGGLRTRRSTSAGALARSPRYASERDRHWTGYRQSLRRRADSHQNPRRAPTTTRADHPDTLTTHAAACGPLPDAAEGCGVGGHSRRVVAHQRRVKAPNMPTRSTRCRFSPSYREQGKYARSNRMMVRAFVTSRRVQGRTSGHSSARTTSRCSISMGKFGESRRCSPGFSKSAAGHGRERIR